MLTFDFSSSWNIVSFGFSCGLLYKQKKFNVDCWYSWTKITITWHGCNFKVIPQYGIAHNQLRTIIASLAHANERVHAHNQSNFPQAKLDNEINVPFLLNEHGYL